jgi:hypothetical protein
MDLSIDKAQRSLHRSQDFLLTGAHLVISQETLGAGVLAGFAATCLLVYVSPGVVIVVTLAEGEGTAVERNTDDEFVRRASHVLPELKAIVLCTHARDFETSW